MAKDDKLNKLLDDMATAGMAKTKNWTTLWESSMRYFFGDQVSDFPKHKNFNYIIVNYLWPSAFQEIAKLSRNNPQIYVTPHESSDAEAAEVWQGNLQWQWNKGLNKTGMRIEQLKAILDCKIFGYRVSKVYWSDKCYWDEATQQWVGDVKYKLWHPAEFWADDDERIDDGNCGTSRLVPLDWAKRQWPDFASKLEEEVIHPAASSSADIPGSKAESSAIALATGKYPGGSERDMIRPSNYIVDFVQSRLESSAPTGVKLVRIEEIYFRDDAEEDVEINEDIPAEELILSGRTAKPDGLTYVDSATGQPIGSDNWPKRLVRKYKKPLYPNGRFIIRCGHTILNPDPQSQIYKYSRWPFVVVPHYLLPHMWQGSNAVELYRSMQDMINTSVSYLFNNVKMYGAPKVAVENDAVAIDPTTKRHFSIGAGAGSIIRLVRGGLARFKIIPPPPMSPAVAMLYQLFSQEFKNITGLQSIARGEQARGEMTATEAATLAMSSNDRVYLQSVMEDEWVKSVMGLVAEICQDRYSPDRFIRIVGEDQPMGIVQITQKLKTLQFDVDIQPSSQLPFDEEKRRMDLLQAYQLLNQPTVNPLLPEILRSLHISSYKKILRELPAYQQYIGIVQLYQQVVSGKMDPAQAVQIIIQEAQKIYMMGGGQLQVGANLAAQGQEKTGGIESPNRGGRNASRI